MSGNISALHSLKQNTSSGTQANDRKTHADDLNKMQKNKREKT